MRLRKAASPSRYPPSCRTRGQRIGRAGSAAYAELERLRAELIRLQRDAKARGALFMLFITGALIASLCGVIWCLFRCHVDWRITNIIGVNPIRPTGVLFVWTGPTSIPGCPACAARRAADAVQAAKHRVRKAAPPRELKKGDSYVERIKGPMRYGGPRDVVMVKEFDDDEGGWS